MIYERIKQGTFPPPIKLSERASAWPESEVLACNEATIKRRSPEEIRQLVETLKQSRQCD
ncbi:MAG: AlpA family phage regulatory protein [Brachymonas sp.]|nr:AlpA family phage regulatory protein [Brachymonas sp.]